MKAPSDLVEQLVNQLEIQRVYNFEELPDLNSKLCRAGKTFKYATMTQWSIEIFAEDDTLHNYFIPCFTNVHHEFLFQKTPSSMYVIYLYTFQKEIQNNDSSILQRWMRNVDVIPVQKNSGMSLWDLLKSEVHA